MKKKISLLIQTTLLALFVQGCWAGENKQVEQIAESAVGKSELASQDGIISNWIGTYESAVPANVTEKLRIYKSKFSFGDDCQEVIVDFVTISETELVFEVDPKSNCGFAGWIIALSMPNPELKVISFKAYRNLDDFRSGKYRMSLTYSKLEE